MSPNAILNSTVSELIYIDGYTFIGDDVLISFKDDHIQENE